MPSDVAAVNVACYRKPVVTERSAQESHSGTLKQRHLDWRIEWARKSEPDMMNVYTYIVRERICQFVKLSQVLSMLILCAHLNTCCSNLKC